MFHYAYLCNDYTTPMKQIRIFIFLIICTFIAGFCSCGSDKEDKLHEAADSFAVAYFNWQFVRAVKYATPESRQWLSYLASQVSQEDVDSLRNMEQGAECEISHINTNNNDSMATVVVNVRNFMDMDSIGKGPHLVEQARFKLPLVYRNDKWKVDLKSILRHEK